MLLSGLNELGTIIRVKHLFLLLLATTLALLGLNTIHYRLIPLWALHLSPDRTVQHDETLWCFATEDTNSNLTTALVVIHGGNAKGTSTIATFRLPNFDSLLYNSNKNTDFRLSKLKPMSHARLPFAPILAMSSFLWNNSLLAVTISVRPSLLGATSRNYVLSAWDQETAEVLWTRSVGPAPSNSTERSAQFTPILLTSSICLTVGRKHCGIIFVLVPTQRSDNSYHFSTLALSVRNGQILWHHLPGDFGEDINPVNDSISYPHWKLRLLAQLEAHLHIGESPWQVYRDVILKAFPLHWYGKEDSRIQLVHHAVRGNESPGSDRSKVNAVLITHPQGVDLLDIASGRPLARLLIEWRRGSTYANIPSVNESRIFGHTLTMPALHQLRINSAIIPTSMSGRGVHVRFADSVYSSASDNDHQYDDNVEPDLFHPDPVVFGQGDFSHQVDCRGRLTGLESYHTNQDATGPIVPNGHTVLYTGLCRPVGLWEYARLGRPDWLEDETKSIPPLILKHTTHPGFLRSLLDATLRRHGAVRSHDHTVDPDLYDLIFLTSDGSMSSISNRGHENWHINAEVSWLQVSRTMAASQSGQPLDTQLYSLYVDHFRPSLRFVSLTPLNADFTVWHSALFSPSCLRWNPPHGQEKGGRSRDTKSWLPTLSVVVATGWDSVSVIDPVSGSLLASHRLPCRPTHPLTLVRLPQSEAEQSLVNAAFIIPCEGILLAFGLAYEVRFAAFLLTVFCLFGSFLVLHWCNGLSFSMTED